MRLICIATVSIALLSVSAVLGIDHLPADMQLQRDGALQASSRISDVPRPRNTPDRVAGSDDICCTEEDDSDDGASANTDNSVGAGVDCQEAPPKRAKEVPPAVAKPPPTSEIQCEEEVKTEKDEICSTMTTTTTATLSCPTTTSQMVVPIFTSVTQEHIRTLVKIRNVPHTVPVVNVQRPVHKVVNIVEGTMTLERHVHRTTWATSTLPAVTSLFTIRQPATQSCDVIIERKVDIQPACQIPFPSFPPPSCEPKKKAVSYRKKPKICPVEEKKPVETPTIKERAPCPAPEKKEEPNIKQACPNAYQCACPSPSVSLKDEACPQPKNLVPKCALPPAPAPVPPAPLSSCPPSSSNFSQPQGCQNPIVTPFPAPNGTPPQNGTSTEGKGKRGLVSYIRSIFSSKSKAINSTVTVTPVDTCGATPSATAAKNENVCFPSPSVYATNAGCPLPDPRVITSSIVLRPERPSCPSLNTGKQFPHYPCPSVMEPGCVQAPPPAVYDILARMAKQ